MLYFLPMGRDMLYRCAEETSESLMPRTGYALLSGHLMTNGTGWPFAFRAIFFG